MTNNGIALDYVIIFFSCFLKLPQIHRIWTTRSVQSLSYWMFYLEIVCYTIATWYGYRKGYPLGTYAENITLLIETFAIVALFLYFDGKPLYYATCGTCVVFVFGFIFQPWLQLSENVKFFEGGLNIASRLPQIYASYAAHSTGNLDVFMVAMSVVGNVVRIATTFLENDGDRRMLFTFVSVALLNCVMLGQIYYYRSMDILPQMETYWNNVRRSVVVIDLTAVFDRNPFASDKESYKRVEFFDICEEHELHEAKEKILQEEVV